MASPLRLIRTNLNRLLGSDEEPAEVPLVIDRIVGDEQPEARVRSSLDLTGKDKLVMVLGAGSSGKTTLMRWITERTLNDGRELSIATTDVGRATLRRFFKDADGPTNEAGINLWLEGLFGFLIRSPMTAAVDFRADMTLVPILEGVPDMHRMLERAGVHPVVLYMLTPRVEDLTVLRAMEAVGFQPKATALVMNVGKAINPADAMAEFRAIRAHSLFQSVVKRGAVQLWMPNLVPARDIENAGLSFTDTQKLETEPVTASRTFHWLREMEMAFDPIATWLP
jgi:hypothetical protein